jgi:hypothetical protein
MTVWSLQINRSHLPLFLYRKLIKWPLRTPMLSVLQIRVHFSTHLQIVKSSTNFKSQSSFIFLHKCATGYMTPNLELKLIVEYEIYWRYFQSQSPVIRFNVTWPVTLKFLLCSKIPLDQLHQYRFTAIYDFVYTVSRGEPVRSGNVFNFKIVTNSIYTYYQNLRKIRGVLADWSPRSGWGI